MDVLDRVDEILDGSVDAESEGSGFKSLVGHSQKGPHLGLFCLKVDLEYTLSDNLRNYNQRGLHLPDEALNVKCITADSCAIS